MSTRRHLLALAVTTAALVVGTFPTGAEARPRADDPAGNAVERLRDDAGSGLVLDRGAGGAVRFVGTSARGGIRNPAVPRDASARAAARAHLDRYGPALRAALGTTFVVRGTTRAASGVEVVGYRQEVGGIPVIGGEAVVALDADRTLRSLSATVSPQVEVTSARVARADAARTALAVVTRADHWSGLTAEDQGRWILDPAVVGPPLPGGPRTVWRFEVGDAQSVRRLVLVDDHTGGVIADLDLVQHADRVVCNQNNNRAAETTCTSGFVRTESSGASLYTDVNAAFDLSGAVSDFYAQIASTDLTAALGVDVGGAKKLASTVRVCTLDPLDDCPYPNAYWNGQQMYYGAGFARADDVVGHEMTHGFIDQHSALFYWGQPGAINESMADVIGEIIDHRNPSSGDTATDWRLGEDLPIGAIRSMSAPSASPYGQPDRTSSPFYDPDASYLDNGGVHTNSGVGNKTAYLISQGGTFNGQSITGIDGADAGLTKTATLYVDVIERLPAGADWATLGQQLDQSCQDLLALGTAGFTPADCTAVHQAGVATELASPPAKVPTTAPAPASCPAGTDKRVLFDSEAGDPATTLTPDVGAPSGWRRGSGAFPSDTWYVDDPSVTDANSLRMTTPVALPAGQASFLSVRGWWALDFVPSGDDAGYYDGGTVELSVDAGPATALTTGWANGPNHVLTTKYLNPWGGLAAFAGDSRGWVQSRADLTAYAGHDVLPQFTMRADSAYGQVGWALDDITVYTCDPGPPPGAPGSVSAVGGVGQAQIRWSAPSVNPGSVVGYRIVASNGAVVRTGAGARTGVVSGLGSAGYGFEVRAMGAYGYLSGPLRVTLAGTATSLKAKRFGRVVKLRGVLSRGGAGYAGRTVVLERKSGGSWVRVAVVQTTSAGAFARKVTRRTAATYRARFAGGPGVMGSVSPQRRK